MVERTGDGLIERHLRPFVDELWSDFRVVLINGPRQSAKTTMLKQLHAQLGGSFYSTDRPADLQAAQADPVGLAVNSPRPVFIDEIQLGGDNLVRGVKIAVDEFPPWPGSFVLSGSSRFLKVPNLSESLAGRMVLTELLPLSMAERTATQPTFIDELLGETAKLACGPESSYHWADYLELMGTGGFPAALRSRSARARASWFSSYVTTITHRDILEPTHPSVADLMPGLLTLVALPVWWRCLMSLPTSSPKPIWTPKFHLADTGLAMPLMQRSPASLSRPDTAVASALFETFVVTEIVKQLAATGDQNHAYHYRDRGGTRLDCVVEQWGGKVAGIEVASTQSINASDFEHLITMRDQMGSDFRAGVVFYAGTQRLSFGDRLVALPASALWAGRTLPDT